MSTAPRSRRLALATGLTYHVLDWPAAAAAERAAPFVLVHGFTDLAHAWDDVAARLVDHGRVVAPDLRGHGDSDWIGAGGYYHFIHLSAEVYSIDTLPFAPRPLDGVIVAAVSIGISLLATLYPASAAARVLPAEALRYE